MEDLTYTILDYLFPFELRDSTKVIVSIIGEEGSGKTTLANYLAYEAMLKYKENFVAYKSETLVRLLRCFELLSKPCALLFVDDATQANVSDRDIQKFFKMRSSYEEKLNSPCRLVCCFAIHRFFNFPSIIRSNSQIQFFLSSSQIPYDRAFLKNWLGLDGLEFLDYITKERLKGNPEVRGKCIVKCFDSVGVFSFKKVENVFKNYSVEEFFKSFGVSS